MCGKKSTLTAIIQNLTHNKDISFTSEVLKQGKTSRWVIFWFFQSNNLLLNDLRTRDDNKNYLGLDFMKFLTDNQYQVKIIFGKNDLKVLKVTCQFDWFPKFEVEVRKNEVRIKPDKMTEGVSASKIAVWLVMTK